MHLIDTHLHLLHRGALGYSWTESIPALADGSFTTDDYYGLAGERVAGALYMEMAVDGADGYRDEARLFADLARKDGNGLIGLIASCRPEQADGFEDWVAECKAMGVTGFRRVLHEEPDDLSQSDVFRRNVRTIGRHDLPYDLCFAARQLPIARDLAAACPDMPLVLNHCGVPDIAGGGLDPWRADMTAIAELPHVVCKLSGLTTYCAPDDRSMSAIRPYVDHVLEVFGPDRMVWGSDWPVVNLGAGLPGWLDLTAEILAGLSSDEAAKIARGTAARLYGVSPG